MGDMVVVRFTCYVAQDTQKAGTGLQQIELENEWGVLRKAQRRERKNCCHLYPSLALLVPTRA